MRISLSFSLDSDADAGLIRWLASAKSRSAVVRQALYTAMGARDSSASLGDVLVSVRRIEAAVSELKASVVAAAGTVAQVGPSGSAVAPTSTPSVPSAPADVVSNLKKLRR